MTPDGAWFGTYTETLPTTNGPAVDRLPGGALPSARVRVISSRDGGSSFDEPAAVADLVVVRRFSYANQDAKQIASYDPQIAVDPTQGLLGGRLYFLWADGWQGLRFSYSSDKGRTWSAPMTLATVVSNDGAVSLSVGGGRVRRRVDVQSLERVWDGLERVVG